MPYRAARRYRPPPVLHRLLSSTVAALAAHGFSPANTVALEVVGRRSGRLRRTAVVLVDHQGQRFIVSLGGESEWVRNVRAAAGKAILRRGKRTSVRLVEVLPVERAPVLLAYASHRAFPGLRPTSPATTSELSLIRAFATSPTSPNAIRCS